MKKAIAIGILMSLVLSGCSTTDSTVDTSNLKYSLELIEPDSMTLNYGNQLSIQNAQGQTIEYPTAEEVQVFGEIQLTGTPVPIYETTEDGSVIYNGTTFDGLANKVESLSKPCSNEALITFIIDSVTSKSGTVYVYVDDDSSEDLEVADDTSTPVSESIAGSPSYEAIVNKYGSEVQWLLTLNGDNVSYIYGCSSYMLYWGSTEVQSVDYGGEAYKPTEEGSTEMNETDSTTEEITTESGEESTSKSEEESTSESEEESTVEDETTSEETESTEQETETVEGEE